MLLLLLAAPLALIGAPLLGGRYRSLARLRFRCVWLAAAALAIQIAIITVLPGPRNGVRVLAHIGSYLLAGAFSMTVEGARLAFLGDVFAVPVSWPLSGVFSAGDVLIALGVALTILRAAGSRPRLSRRRAASSDDPRSLAR
jgi:hypothetical protein